MTLETGPVEALLFEATNHYAVRYPGGKTKRRGNLGDTIAWKRVPNGQVVADAVVNGLLDGTLPETTIRWESRASKFVSVTRRDSSKVGVLVNDATGEETSLPRLCRWYKAKDSPYRIEHRWTDAGGKEHKTTPPGASSIHLLMDLPDGPLGDIDLGWYVGAAAPGSWPTATSPISIPSGSQIPPSPKASTPAGSLPARTGPARSRPVEPRRTVHPSSGNGIDTTRLGCTPGRRPASWCWTSTSRRSSASGLEHPLADLAGSLVSYHRQDSPDAVRSGAVPAAS